MSTEDKTVVSSLVQGAAVGTGTRLNGIYEIDELIAEGGMGKVYKGHNIQNKSPVAIKIILSELANDETVLSLFRRESDTLNNLSHDSIVRYHLFGEDPLIGRLYLAMEFVDGVSLADYTTENPLSLDDTVRLLRRLASGLSVAHGAGVIHRDLSPDNIILPTGKVSMAKIIDFGIAKNTASGMNTVLGGKFAGKYGFVSPEQLGRYKGVVTECSDIYSLALVGAAALQGKPIDMSGSPVEVVEKRSVVPNLDFVEIPFRSVLETMLQPDPSQRPQNMNAVISLLDNLGSNMGGANDDASVPTPSSSELSHPAPEIEARVESSWVAPDRAVVTSLVEQSVGLGSSTSNSFQPNPASESPFGSEPVDDGFASQWPAEPELEKKPVLGWVILLALLLVGGVGASWYFLTLSPSEKSNEIAANPKVDAEKKMPEDGEEKVAIIPNPDPPISELVKPKLDKVAQRLNWFTSYDGGPCFYLSSVEVNADSTAKIVGYGNSEASFEKMMNEFTQQYGVEPEVGVRLIKDRQCPVTRFLKEVKTYSGSSVKLELSKDLIKSGQAIRGALSGVSGRFSEILLVDTDGFVYNLTHLTKKSHDIAALDMTPQFPSKTPEPQMLLGFASDVEIPEVSLSNPKSAATFLPSILEAARKRGVELTVAVQYFKIGG